jgi:hypothetical protein
MEDGGWMDRILDQLADEKSAKRESERMLDNLSQVRGWKIRRAKYHHMGLQENTDHCCTKDCHDKGFTQIIADEVIDRNTGRCLKPAVYGCIVSGMVHICNPMSTVCPFTFVNGDCRRVCVFSGMDADDKISNHEWSFFVPSSVKDTHETAEQMVTMNPVVNEVNEDWVIDFSDVLDDEEEEEEVVEEEEKEGNDVFITADKINRRVSTSKRQPARERTVTFSVGETPQPPVLSFAEFSHRARTPVVSSPMTGETPRSVVKVEKREEEEEMGRGGGGEEVMPDAELYGQMSRMELLSETRDNLAMLESDTDEIIDDLVWDGQTKKRIYNGKRAESHFKACKAVADYVRASHTFVLMDNSGKDEGVEVPLLPLITEMDAIYAMEMNKIGTLEIPKRDHPRKQYYINICTKMWRFISYYGGGGEGEEGEREGASYAAFVTGMLYTLKQDGLFLGNVQILQPDPFLQRYLPHPSELDWKPSAILSKLMKSGEADKNKTSSYQYDIPRGMNNKSSVFFVPRKGTKASAKRKRRSKPNAPFHRHQDGVPANLRAINIGASPLVASVMSPYVVKKEEEPPKDPSLPLLPFINSSSPGWNPTATICTSKKALINNTGYGRRGRSYGRSTITTGKNYLKRYLRKFASSQKSVDAVLKMYQSEIHTLKNFSQEEKVKKK